MLEIPPDFTTLFLQVGLFVVLWLVLARFWFRPALRIIHERAARSEGAIAEAKAIQAEAERLRAEHAAALDEVRGEAQREMHEIVRSAETAQKQMISEAREDAQRTLAEVRGRIAEEVATARRSLREQAESIAREVAQKVLGRPV